MMDKLENHNYVNDRCGRCDVTPWEIHTTISLCWKSLVDMGIIRNPIVSNINTDNLCNDIDDNFIYRYQPNLNLAIAMQEYCCTK